jgi:hypothetical protein
MPPAARPLSLAATVSFAAVGALTSALACGGEHPTADPTPASTTGAETDPGDHEPGGGEASDTADALLGMRAPSGWHESTSSTDIASLAGYWVASDMRTASGDQPFGGEVTTPDNWQAELANPTDGNERMGFALQAAPNGMGMMYKRRGDPVEHSNFEFLFTWAPVVDATDAIVAMRAKKQTAYSCNHADWPPAEALPLDVGTGYYGVKVIDSSHIQVTIPLGPQAFEKYNTGRYNMASYEYWGWNNFINMGAVLTVTAGVISMYRVTEDQFYGHAPTTITPYNQKGGVFYALCPRDTWTNSIQPSQVPKGCRRENFGR